MCVHAHSSVLAAWLPYICPCFASGYCDIATSGACNSCLVHTSRTDFKLSPYSTLQDTCIMLCATVRDFQTDFDVLNVIMMSLRGRGFNP